MVHLALHYYFYANSKVFNGFYRNIAKKALQTDYCNNYILYPDFEHDWQYWQGLEIGIDLLQEPKTLLEADIYTLVIIWP